MAKARINLADITTLGVDEDALTDIPSGQTVFNFGNLTSEGDLANGIFAGADDVTIRILEVSKRAVTVPPAFSSRVTMPGS